MYGTSTSGYFRFWSLCQTAAQSRASLRSGGEATRRACSANLEEHFRARRRAGRLGRLAVAGLTVGRKLRLTRAALLLDHRPEDRLDADVIEMARRLGGLYSGKGVRRVRV